MTRTFRIILDQIVGKKLQTQIVEPNLTLSEAQQKVRALNNGNPKKIYFYEPEYTVQ